MKLSCERTSSVIRFFSIDCNSIFIVVLLKAYFMLFVFLIIFVVSR